MCAQTRPRFMLSSEIVLGEWSQNPCYLQGKNRLDWKNSPQRRIETTALQQGGQRAQHTTNELFWPPRDTMILLLKWKFSFLSLQPELNMAQLASCCCCHSQLPRAGNSCLLFCFLPYLSLFCVNRLVLYFKVVFCKSLFNSLIQELIHFVFCNRIIIGSRLLAD